jgi:thiamine monophosphate synthase
MGGIDLINLNEVKEIGFNYIGVHGAIWGFNNPVERFIHLRDAWMS